jgi:hypothetical protein|tara:strand:+ start:1349 stop:2230 length:882 start_codon:yes stop_codon:yes gene_type:complete
MSELTQETAEPTPEAQPTVDPMEITPDVFQTMYEESVSGFTADTTEVAPPTAEPVETETPAGMSDQDRMWQMQQTIASQAAHINQQAANTNNAPTTPAPTVEESVALRNPDMTPAQAKWLAGEVSQIAGPMMQGMHEQVQYLSNRQNRADQDGNVADFDNHVDALMDNHEIGDAWTRKVMRHAIVNEGLDRHGNNFSKDLATREFITLNNQRLERAQAAEETYVNSKQRAVSETPPVSGPVSTSTAVKGIRDAVRNPDDKKMDFRGDKMTQLVSGYLGAMEQGLDGALGGSDS